MPWTRRLGWAESAVAYVEATMARYPTDNRADDLAHLPRESHWQAQKAREKYYDDAYSRYPWDYLSPSFNTVGTVHLAQLYGRVGLGNCGEMASLAFSWLVHEKSIHEGVSLYSLMCPYGRKQRDEILHTFVLIGEPSEPTAFVVMDDRLIPGGWPMDAVWCDPWRRVCFEIKDDWQKHVDRILEDCAKANNAEVASIAPLPWTFVCGAYAPPGGYLADGAAQA